MLASSAEGSQQVGPRDPLLSRGTDVNPADTPQPPPVPSDRPAVWDLVVADMHARNAFGCSKYGTPSQPHNGRDVLTDLYQELLDAVVYLRQAIYERDGR